MTGAAVPDDSRKTKAQLFSELEILRARITELEHNAPSKNGVSPVGPLLAPSADVVSYVSQISTVLKQRNFSEAAQIIYCICKRLLNAATGEVLLFHAEKAEHELLFSDATDNAGKKFPLLSNDLYERTQRQRKVICINDFSSSKFARFRSRSRVRLKNVLLAPLRMNSEHIGLLCLADKRGRFSRDDRELAAVFADLIALLFQYHRDMERLSTSEAGYRRLYQAPESTFDEQVAKLHQTETLAEMGQMISAVAHEIRNILHIIQSGSENIRHKLKNDPEGLQILDEIDYGIGILSALGNELLDYAKPVKLQKERCMLKKLVENALTAAGSKLQRVEVRLNLKNQKTEINVDSAKMTRVLLNIIANAVDAMPEGGLLIISSSFLRRKQAPVVLLSVADTGCGISRRDLERVQKPFITTKEHGTGLGISICKKIIHAHGGEFLIKSQVNKGTTVQIFLPDDDAV